MTKRTGRTGLIAVLGLFAGLGLAAAWRAPAHAADGGCLPSRCRPEPADAAVREAERAALVTLYTALDGPNWFQRDFWGSDRPVAEWHGVQTDADGYVVQLTIYDNNLTGEIPPAVCRLQRLHTLHLSFNNLSGAVPDGLGACAR